MKHFLIVLFALVPFCFSEAKPRVLPQQQAAHFCRLLVNDGEGREMYRFVVVQNSPHWPQLAIGELGWQFMKRFSRHSETGELEIGG